MRSTTRSASTGVVALAPLAERAATAPAAAPPVDASAPLVLTVPSDSPTRHNAPPRRLTPLEKKVRDKIRKREQAARRLQRLRERDNAALTLQHAKTASSAWHQKEREEEELVLRRLERDAVLAHKTHPAAAGYEFACSDRSVSQRIARTGRGVSTQTLSHNTAAATCSPVFTGFSHARCPSSQLPSALHERAPFGGVCLEATYRHPACQGYAMAHDDDSARISPVFFFAAFAKIPLERIVLEADSDGDDDDDDGDEDNDNTHAVAKLSPSERAQLHALMATRFAPLAATGGCLTCKSTASPTPGCPGCFTFSHEQHRQAMSSLAAQRHTTTKTRAQEQVERIRGLQRQLVMLSPQQQGDALSVSNASSAQQCIDDYYTHVLVDHQAIRKHRTITSDCVTLHIKTLPLGSILSLCVDIRSSVAYVYELYRAHTELPNRPIHLLLPTTTGLFYLDERIEAATDVRNGLVYGELLLEDFHLHAAAASDNIATSTASTSQSRAFLLFSVAVLHPTSTPQLVSHYLQHNFRLLPHELASADRFAIYRAVSALPPAVALDACQRKLLPHVRHMQVVGDANRQLAVAETQREHEALLRSAFNETRALRLAERKRKRQLAQQHGHVSATVRRALAYFAHVCDSTQGGSSSSNSTRNAAAQQRLAKLWHCFQLFDAWKLCKHGRLLDAQTTDVTLALLEAHADATTAAFACVLERAPGEGPLAYPVLWLAGTRKLVVRLGTRLGVTLRDDRMYGLLLDLEQDFDALEAALVAVAPEATRRTGATQQALARVAQQDDERQLADALAHCTDVEWRASSTEPPALFTSNDLLRPPFYTIDWLRLARAYRQAMRAVAHCAAQLDAFNALARVLQREDAVLSRAQIAKWQRDADAFVVALASPSASPATSCLVLAARRVLGKKGAAVLGQRTQQRTQQLRAREDELARLQQLQLDLAQPKRSVAEQLKVAFMRDTAPKMRAALERTPAETLALRASQLIDKVAAGANSVAKAAKKEYRVRAL